MPGQESAMSNECFCWPGESLGVVWMSVDSLMDSGASLESLTPTNILFSWEKKHQVWMRFSQSASCSNISWHTDADTHTPTPSSPSLWNGRYLKFTILVDLYGPLKLVLIFAASTAPRHCALNTLHSGEKNYFKWSETLEKRQLSFCKTKSMLYIYKLFI